MLVWPVLVFAGVFKYVRVLLHTDGFAFADSLPEDNQTSLSGDTG